MFLRVVLGIALVAVVCKAAPSKSAAEEQPTVCRPGETKKKGCNDCFCLAGYWSCSFKACFSNEEFVPGSFLCKLAPNVRGCQAVEKPDVSETEAKPAKGHHHTSTSRPSTAIIFPTVVDPEPPERLCPPGPVKEHRNPNPSPAEKDIAPDHRGGEQSEFDIDIRGGPRPSAEDTPQPAGNGERPTRCRSKPALASGSSSSGVSVASIGPVRRPKPRPGNRPPQRPKPRPGNRPPQRTKPRPEDRPARRPVPTGDRRTPSGGPQKQQLPDRPSRPRPETGVRRRPRPRTLGQWWIPE